MEASWTTPISGLSRCAKAWWNSSSCACSIVKELLSIGPLVAGESTVYPVLKRLEADGMLVSHWVTSEAGPPRKYYSLSADGARFLADAQRAWESLVQSVSTLKEDNGE